MTDTDYQEILRTAYRKFCEIKERRDELTAELDRLRQFIFATANMLPEDLQAEEVGRMNFLNEATRAHEASLVDAIRKVLSDSPARSFTARQMRNALMKGGFDFSQYTTNPLASVSTTLKRLKPDEVMVTTIEGVTAYRAKKGLLERAKARASAFYGELSPTGKLSEMK